MTYTKIWNQEFIKNTANLKDLDLCLEIGCFEGLTSNHIVTNTLSSNGKLICIDPLTDGYLSENLTEKDLNDNKTIYNYFNKQYDRFIENVGHHIESKKIELYRDLSSNVFGDLIDKYENQIDFIYIDGDHRASAVYIDAINSFKLCKKNGLILFDDYVWGNEYGEESTRKGVDRFLKEFEGRYETLIIGYQYMIRKIS